MPRNRRALAVLAVPVVLLGVSSPLSAQYVTRVSRGPGGVQANGASRSPSISRDGAFVHFDSGASNLLPGDVNANLDVVRFDRLAGTSTSGSPAPSGGPSTVGSASAGSQTLTADGRFAVFQSSATDYVLGDTNGKEDVFVHDFVLGTTTLVSVSSNGAQGNDHSMSPSITPDGRYVAFTSYASNLVVGDTNGFMDVFVRDLQLGVTTRESLSMLGAEGDGISWNGFLSDDGRYVVFTSNASTLVPGDSNGGFDVFRRDRLSSAIERVNVGPMGAQVPYAGWWTSMSADGMRVAFDAPDAVDPAHGLGFNSVFVRDFVTSALIRAAVDSDGLAADGRSWVGTLSPDGRFLTFTSEARNVVWPPTDGGIQAYARDLLTGEVHLLSQLGDGTRPSRVWGAGSSIVSDRWVALTMADVGAVDTNGVSDVHLADLEALPVRTFCSGDGSTIPCPCGNDGAPLHGCANSAHAAGGRLRAGGICSVGNDAFDFEVHDAAGSAFVLIQGDSALPPTPLGDGLSCLGGTLIRIGARPLATGAGTYLAPGVAPASLRGGVPPSGATRYYQAFYRNASVSFCTPATSNRTNGVVVRWVP